jgi:hypothetical protein
MVAAEFHAQIVNGRIEVPEALRDQFQGNVNVILFVEGADENPSAWPVQNRRRWRLIAKRVKMGLTDAEQRDLDALQQLADQHLAQVGPRPVDELERWYAQLSQEG